MTDSKYLPKAVEKIIVTLKKNHYPKKHVDMLFGEWEKHKEPMQKEQKR